MVRSAFTLSSVEEVFDHAKCANFLRSVRAGHAAQVMLATIWRACASGMCVLQDPRLAICVVIFLWWSLLYTCDCGTSLTNSTNANTELHLN